ncbi:MAG TPA: hypothetical protein VFQ53_33870 [Kofleriaceae bacterium]|nr:hypothetical protein [Kofleriaceae bacterium]
MSAPANRTTGVLLSPIQAAQLLERVVCERIAEMFDFDDLEGLEGFLVLEMMRIANITADEAIPLARQMVDRGLAALVHDERRTAYDGRDASTCELCEQEANAKRRTIDMIGD